MANTEKKKENNGRDKKLSNIGKVLDGSFLSKETVVNRLPFIFFLTFLGIMYIANTYYAEITFKEIKKTEKEIKDLRSEHISTASEFMFASKQSEVALRVDTLGLIESRVPPQKIIANKSEYCK